MPGGRHTIPLFELLTRRQTSAPAAGPDAAPSPPPPPAPPPRPRPLQTIESPPRHSKPVVRVELRPRDVEVSPAPSATYGLRPRWFTPLLGGAEIRVPVNLVYFGSAAVVLIMLATWLGGVKWGRLDAERDYNELRARETRDGPIVTEPGPGPTSTLAAKNPQNINASGRPVAPQSPQLLGDLIAATITSKGLLQGDPRTAGFNYLLLAESLPRNSAESAIVYLAANGVEAFAIPAPVDPRSRAANNAGPGDDRVALYALPGITSEEYSQKVTKRTRLEGDVARLGALWQKEQRGLTSFVGAYWKKHQ